MEPLTYQQVKDLQELLAPTKDDSDSDNDNEVLKQRLCRPPETGKPIKTSETSDEKQKNAKESDIWHTSEVKTIKNCQTEDPRQVPEYEIKFKQAVGTEDIFLGMNMKTPATASCEWITVLVKLPKEKRERVELSVESDIVDLRSPMYRLQLPTPFPVDPNSSSAKWDPDAECLEITLKLIRELDDVNF